MTRRTFLTSSLASLIALSACTTVDIGPRADVDRTASWAVLPFINNTETPQAGQRAAAMAEAVLRTRGINNLQRAPSNLGGETLFEPQDAQTLEKGLAWARGAGVRYVLSGTVSEWRYKVGVDGEPAVGLTLNLIDVNSGKTLWSATGGRTGWSREALSAVAQKLMRQLMAPLG